MSGFGGCAGGLGWPLGLGPGWAIALPPGCAGAVCAAGCCGWCGTGGLPFAEGSGCPPGVPGSGAGVDLRSGEVGMACSCAVGVWPGCVVAGCGSGAGGLVCCTGTCGPWCGAVTAAFFATVFGNAGARRAAPATAAPAAATPGDTPCGGVAAIPGAVGVVGAPDAGVAGCCAAGCCVALGVAAGVADTSCGASACAGVTVCASPPGLVIVTILVVLLITTVL